MPLAETTRLADARPIEAREVSWLFSSAPPEEASHFFGAFASIDSFTGAGIAEVERNLARWKGASARAHPFRPQGPIHLALHFLRCISSEATTVTASQAKLSLPSDLVTRPDRRPLLVLHPGSGGRWKRWSRSGFGEVARRWQERSGASLVVIGPAEEDEFTEWCRGQFRVANGLDVVALAGLFAGCDAYLGNDSGASHLAAAVGARGVALFGPTDPECWRPISDGLRSLRLEPWSGCDDAASGDAIDAVERAVASAASP